MTEENGEDKWTNADFLSFNSSSAVDNDDEVVVEEEEERQQRNFNNNKNNNNGNTAEFSYVLDNNNNGSNASSLPPWMMSSSEEHYQYNDPNFYYRVNPLVRLHNEIVSFCKLMEPQSYELLQRKELIARFKKLATKCFHEGCDVKVFGSYETGLVLPTSDIDVTIIIKKEEEENGNESKDDATKDKEEMENWNVNDGGSDSSPLHRLANMLRNEWINDLKYLEVIEKTRVPLVKFQTKEGLNMDISFDQENGPKAAQLMKTFLQAMPPLRPLTFVLKYYLASRGLNEPYSGGIGSYMLQLMIVSFLQHRERESYNHRRPSVYNLGCLLVEFFELYGMDLNYFTTGISVRHDGFYFQKGSRDRREVYAPSSSSSNGRAFSLGIENPLDPNHDVGKGSFKMSLIQRAFDTSFKLLLSHVSEPIIYVQSILQTILPPNKEMHQRAALKYVLSSNSILDQAVNTAVNKKSSVIDLTNITDHQDGNNNNVDRNAICSPVRKRQRRF